MHFTDRDWGDRPSGDKPQSWNNRRNWGGDNHNNEENLPEWYNLLEYNVSYHSLGFV